jgi:hypothetical protein
MKKVIKSVLFGLGVIALIAAVNLTYRLDEWLGCDLGDHAETCVVRGAAAVWEWYSASDYDRFLVGGADHETFLDQQTAICIASHKEKKLSADKSDRQIAVFCGCFANNVSALASARDLRYIAHHKEPPPSLKQKLMDLAPDCAWLADLIVRPQSN